MRAGCGFRRRELAAFDLFRLRQLRGGQRDQLIGPLQVVVLQRRLEDLAREERLVDGVGLHRIEVLGLHERRVQDVGASLRARIRIVPDLAAAREKP